MISTNPGPCDVAQQYLFTIEKITLTLTSNIYHYMGIATPLVTTIPCSDAGRIGVSSSTRCTHPIDPTVLRFSFNLATATLTYPLETSCSVKRA